MRVLFDQGTPVPLRRYLREHQVVTAFEVGWAQLSNRELLANADEQFDVLVTTDKQLRHEQSFAGRNIALLVLPHASWPKLEPHASRIAKAVSELAPRELVELQFD